MSFQSYLGNSNNKTNLIKYLFQKCRETLATLDDATDRLTSQSSERSDCDHEVADAKMVAYIKFFCDSSCLNRVVIVSPVLQ